MPKHNSIMKADNFRASTGHLFKPHHYANEETKVQREFNF